ncbi:MAG TPA: iron-sulfur cluster assembly accessory protein [Thermoplasmata archaeon]|nr:iron-sulfur cluster assembly accessory protein [Thermoplasmata archaeon]HLA46078.1 iron-sulfur cluster assembly accessory protein [Thermoplasmata archaeon]HLF05711.1 iron-sulfur cluster assembly accessory protein [Thermoplasmata archaeon]
MQAAPEMSSSDLVVLLPSAVERIRALRQEFGNPDGALRLRIIAGGCSGMQYRIDFAETPRKGDVIVERDDVKVFVDPKSLTYLKGSNLDYWEDLLGGGFKIVNPNAKSTCSCGVSFTV